MSDGVDCRIVVAVALLLGVIAGLSGIGAAHPEASAAAHAPDAVGLPDGSSAQGGFPAADSAGRAENGGADGSETGEADAGGSGDAGEDEDGGDAGEDGDGGEAGEDEDGGEGASLVGDWWGLGGEATETPYLGLAEFGVAVLGIGLGGYALGKRTSLLPSRLRRYLLPAHEWTMLLGTGLTVPHFLAVEEWEGLGLAVGVLLGVELLSGLYGRHLHRHVVRLGRGGETARPVGRLFEISKRTLFSRWRRIHISLTVATGLALVLHVLTALGE